MARMTERESRTQCYIAWKTGRDEPFYMIHTVFICTENSYTQNIIKCKYTLKYKYNVNTPMQLYAKV